MALDFDLACSARLRIEDGDRELRLLEAVSGGLISRSFGATQQVTEQLRRKEGTF